MHKCFSPTLILPRNLCNAWARSHPISLFQWMQADIAIIQQIRCFQALGSWSEWTLIIFSNKAQKCVNIGIKKLCIYIKITWISLGKVALNNIVCLCPGLGISICSTILRICGSKPMSSIRSASSNAKYCTWARETRALSKRSDKRPGVATRISTPLSSSRSWNNFNNRTYRNQTEYPFNQIWLQESAVRGLH